MTIRQRPAITLIEQLISLGILVGLMLVVINIYIAAGQFANDEAQRIEVGENAARVLATLDDTLREGRAVLANGNVGGTVYTTDDSTLVLALPSIVNGDLTATNDIVVVELNQATGMLEQLTAPFTDSGHPALNSTRPGGTTQLATDVDEAYFRYPTDDPTSASSVSVIVTAGGQINQNRIFRRTIILNETFRNHI